MNKRLICCLLATFYIGSVNVSYSAATIVPLVIDAVNPVSTIYGIYDKYKKAKDIYYKLDEMWRLVSGTINSEGAKAVLKFSKNEAQDITKLKYIDKSVASIIAAISEYVPRWLSDSQRQTARNQNSLPSMGQQLIDRGKVVAFMHGMTGLRNTIGNIDSPNTVEYEILRPLRTKVSQCQRGMLIQELVFGAMQRLGGFINSVPKEILAVIGLAASYPEFESEFTKNYLKPFAAPILSYRWNKNDVSALCPIIAVFPHLVDSILQFVITSGNTVSISADARTRLVNSSKSLIDWLLFKDGSEFNDVIIGHICKTHLEKLKTLSIRYTTSFEYLNDISENNDFRNALSDQQTGDLDASLINEFYKYCRTRELVDPCNEELLVKHQELSDLQQPYFQQIQDLRETLSEQEGEVMKKKNAWQVKAQEKTILNNMEQDPNIREIQQRMDELQRTIDFFSPALTSEQAKLALNKLYILDVRNDHFSIDLNDVILTNVLQKAEITQFTISEKDNFEVVRLKNILKEEKLRSYYARSPHTKLSPSDSELARLSLTGKVEPFNMGEFLENLLQQ